MELVHPGERENPVTAFIVTFAQAAEIMTVSQRTFEKIVDRGEIPSITIGKFARRVWLGDVLDYLARHTRLGTKKV